MKTLDEIKNKYGMNQHMLAILNEWLDTGEATWEQLQVALVRVGNRKLAVDLEKYIQYQQKQQQGVSVCLSVCV